MLTQVPDHNTIIIQQQEQHHDNQSQNDQKGHHKSLSGAKMAEMTSGSLWEPSSSECLGLKCVDRQYLIHVPAGATGENKHPSLSPIAARKKISFLPTEQLSLPPANQCLKEETYSGHMD